MKHEEDKMCMEFTKIMNLNIKFDPLFKNLTFFHIPNGGRRGKREAGRFKKMGVLPGVSDYFIMRGVRGCKGLWVELKYGKNQPTKAQDTFLANARQEGYQAKAVWSVKEALQTVINYLEGGK